ncbi:MAG: hypothetical protein H7237_05850, partial [Alkalinema sp. FL-bin-369]|nr:hypothetical protein [Leptolyngbyaceae cyanobacterium LF-bin-369]
MILLTRAKPGKIHNKRQLDEEYIVDEEQRKKRMFENNEKSIHVGSLPPEAGNDDLEKYFSQFGKVSRAYVIYTLG